MSHHDLIARHRALLAIGVVALLGACAAIVETDFIVRTYEGPPRPRAEISRLEVRPGFNGVDLVLLSVDGRPIPAGTTLLEMEPGMPALEFRCTVRGAVSTEVRKPDEAFTAGWLYRLKPWESTTGGCWYTWTRFERLKR